VGQPYATVVRSLLLSMLPEIRPVKDVRVTAGSIESKLHYITLHKIVFRVPKITRTARTLYEIKGVIWEYSYVGKHLEKR